VDSKEDDMKHCYTIISFFSLGFTLFLLTGAQTCSRETPEQIILPDFAPDYEVKADFSQDLIRDTDWEYTGFLVSIEQNALWFREKSKAFAYPGEAPFCSTAVIRATIKVTEPIKKEWKIAGISVYSDDRYYWQLSLVEQPDSMGTGHFAELTEMYGGTWLAQYEQKTRLTALKEDRSFHWKYNEPYDFILILKGEGITGYILDKKGNVRVNVSYRFDNTAVTSGRPAVVSEGFLTSCFYFEVKGADTVQHTRIKPTFPRFPHDTQTDIEGKATGFFHTESIDGVDWVVGPSGAEFFITGTDHVNYNGMWCEALGYSPYKRNVEGKYENEDAWAASAAERLYSWGFNSLGSNSSLAVRYRGLPYPVNLNIGTRFDEAYHITPKTTWTGFPDVYHPEFRRFCELVAKKYCAPLKNDPWLLGYFLDNELEWHAWTGKGLFADTFSQLKDSPARTALVALIKDHYTDVRDFNKDWNIRIKNFDSLFSLTTAPEPLTENAQALIRTYIRLTAETYFSVTTSSIKKYDPNHMILGCRFAGQAPDIWDIAGRYCDIVSVNCYRTINLENGQITDGFENDLAAWHEKVQKPFMITEWSFPALDAGLPSKHGAGQRVPTQKDKAFAFTSFQKYLFSVPFIVGSNYFMWVDQPALGISSTFPEDSNYGLVKETDEPHTLLTEAAKNINSYAYEIHRGNTTDFSVMPGKPGIFSIENKSRKRGTCTVQIIGKEEDMSVTLDLLPGGTTHMLAPEAEKPEPGFHYVTCLVHPEEMLLEKNQSDNRAVQQWYVPGTAWHVNESSFRIPLLAANSSSGNLNNIPVTLDIPAPAGSEAGAWKLIAGNSGTEEQHVDWMKNGDRGTAALIIDSLTGYGNKDFFLYPASQGKGSVPVEPRQKKTIRLNNGILQVEKKNKQDGTILDSVTMKGTLLGRLVPLVWQYTNENKWVTTDTTESIAVTEGQVITVMHIILSHTKGPGKKYRICYRLTFFPGKSWFTSRFLWIENSDSSAWVCKGYYHYTLSFIGGSTAGDEDVFDHWVDKDKGYCFGVVSTSPEVTVKFWTDPDGNQHPDAYRELNRLLKPGERLELDDPTVYVLGCRVGEWYNTKKEVEDFSRMVTLVWEREER
jgi:hypothetical protein